MTLSFAQRVLKSRRTPILFHTWTVTREVLAQAISENRSIDLDIAIDENGEPYLGHSREYYEKTWSRPFKSMPIWEAIDQVADSTIPALIDCKDFNAWPVVEKIIARIGEPRCVVHAFVSELRFEFSRAQGEPDFVTEWSPIATLRSLKSRFPALTVNASAKWLPADFLVSESHAPLLLEIRNLLKENQIDSVCLNVPDPTFSDASLRFFLDEGIINHVGVDLADTTKLTELYIGESNLLECTSKDLLLP